MQILTRILGKRGLSGLAALGLVSGAGIGAAQAESGTIWIEQGYPYGAMITQQAGVTVFRAMPPIKRVIVNPGGKTPLSLTINEMQVTEQTTVNNNIRVPGNGAWKRSRYRRY